MAPASLSKQRSWADHGRSAKELYHFILAVEYLLKREYVRGRHRLAETIPGIQSNESFCDFPIVYLPKKGEAIFIGDTHGDSLSVRAIIRQEQCLEKLEAGQPLSIIFLGDYADRGLSDIKNLEIILGLKMAYPRQVILLRGNHEEIAIGQYYGLLGSCLKQFGYDDGQQIFREFNDLFDKLPAAVVTGNGIVAVHGGVPVSPVSSLKDLQDEENAVEMRWNDPTEEIDHYVHNYKRGGYFLFGKKVFEEFMSALGGSVLVRSHEYVTSGYKMLFDDRLLTIFSNGGKSIESGYRDFIMSPKYAKVSLGKPLNQWTDQHVFAVSY